MTDLKKLPAAPWQNSGRYKWQDSEVLVECLDNDGGLLAVSEHGENPAKAGAVIDFCAMARNAFDGDPEALAWWEANRVRREKTTANAAS